MKIEVRDTYDNGPPIKRVKICPCGGAFPPWHNLGKAFTPGLQEIPGSARPCPTQTWCQWQEYIESLGPLSFDIQMWLVERFGMVHFHFTLDHKDLMDQRNSNEWKSTWYCTWHQVDNVSWFIGDWVRPIKRKWVGSHQWVILIVIAILTNPNDRLTSL